MTRSELLTVGNPGKVSHSSRFIAVDGPIGVGKTSLARRLADSLSADLVLEEAYENPFLERFYLDGQSAALPAQMFFLFARARQIESLRQSDLFTSVRVSDYLFSKDRLFAELNLSADELSLYKQVEATLAIDAPVDIAVDDLCTSCRRCTIDCPPDAILDDKQIVRGVEKWYVDFDKCIPYFAMTEGCGICIEVCPWSEPGRGVVLSETLLKKRRERSDVIR